MKKAFERALIVLHSLYLSISNQSISNQFISNDKTENVKKNHLATLSVFFLALVGIFLLPACHLHKRPASAGPEVLSATESLKHFQVESGMQVGLVAAEPLISTPVAATFDEKGRMWVVEMIGYMPDTTGKGEKQPVGKIVILEDRDKDGEMDTRKVFLDSLVMPRALCLYQGGLLVAEPPNLWFVERHGDTAGTRELVDKDYAEGGNVEHQPNGLLRGLDNWIYNAKSAKRYRRIHGQWVIQHTHFRGQWGVTEDNQGRLFYNTNSDNLLGDYFPPGLGAWNPDQRSVAGYDENIVPDNRTYPIHATPGVNRGYQSTVLDSAKRLISFTAACGPLIYGGSLLGAAYEGNAFVCGPAANLVKRNILTDDGFAVRGNQAYQGKEFLSSDDERFRPVNLYTGPDGALYILDMYRGVIQHVTYLTSYLKHQIAIRHLQAPLNCGRIYRVYPKGRKLAPKDLSSATVPQLVSFLDDQNSWARETAERLLVDGNQQAALPLLRQKLQTDAYLPGKLRAFWTLDGLGGLTPDDIAGFLESGDAAWTPQAVAAAANEITPGNAAFWIAAATKAAGKADTALMPYVGFLAAAVAQVSYPKAAPLLLQLARRFPDNRFISDAIISGLASHEPDFLREFEKSGNTGSTVFARRLRKVITDAKMRREALKKQASKSRFEKGQELFATHCQVCHGSDGNGIRSLGAPLNGSNWVLGNKNTLISIVLCGLTGPIKIGDKVYRQPEVADEMPAIGQNTEFSDTDIAQILSYIRNGWNNTAPAVQPEEVTAMRKRNQGRQQPFTMEELKNIR